MLRPLLLLLCPAAAAGGWQPGVPAAWLGCWMPQWRCRADAAKGSARRAESRSTVPCVHSNVCGTPMTMEVHYQGEKIGPAQLVFPARKPTIPSAQPQTLQAGHPSCTRSDHATIIAQPTTSTHPGSVSLLADLLGPAYSAPFSVQPGSCTCWLFTCNQTRFKLQQHANSSTDGRAPFGRANR